MDDAGPISTARTVAARSLPTPAHVSPQLQRSIATMAAAAASGVGLTAIPTPTTAEGWKAVVAQADAQTLALVPVFAAAFPHTEHVRQIAGVTVREITPLSLDPSKSDRLLVNFHGGGYVLNGGPASTSEAVLGAHYSGLRVISVDYRMPPDHPFPAALDDAVAVWKALIAERPAASIGAFGTSAGGGLTLALTLKLKALGLPLPGALALGTPWADLTGGSDSYQVNAGVDGVFSRFDGFAAGMAALYAGATGVNDPLVSPIFGDFGGFPRPSSPPAPATCCSATPCASTAPCARPARSLIWKCTRRCRTPNISTPTIVRNRRRRSVRSRGSSTRMCRNISARPRRPSDGPGARYSFK